MPSVVNEHNKNLLSEYDIDLKKELKSASVVRFNGRDTDSRISMSLYEKLIHAADNKENFEVKLPNITFGVEFEFVGSSDPKDVSAFNYEMAKLFKEKYFYTGTYTHNDGASWILGKDSSIKTDWSKLKHPFGFELSSPRLRYANKDDMAVLHTVVDLIKTLLHGEVNKSCGTHIHIGFSKKDFKSELYRGSICDLLSTYSAMEKTVFDTIVPIHRRRNRFCRQTQPWPRNKYQKLSSRFCDFNYDGECKTLHFEFRQLEGTLDINTIMYWADLQAIILFDVLYHIGHDDFSYVKKLMKKNIFEILFHYKLNKSLVNFFLGRAIDFKSRTIQTNQ